MIGPVDAKADGTWRMGDGGASSARAAEQDAKLCPRWKRRQEQHRAGSGVGGGGGGGGAGLQMACRRVTLVGGRLGGEHTGQLIGTGGMGVRRWGSGVAMAAAAEQRRWCDAERADGEGREMRARDAAGGGRDERCPVRSDGMPAGAP